MAAPSASTCTPARSGKAAKPRRASPRWPPGAKRRLTDAERAALALAEAATRVSDQANPVTDEIWNEAARHFDQQALAALVVAIAAINTWNRLNITTGQIAGEWTGQWVA